MKRVIFPLVIFAFFITTYSIHGLPKDKKFTLKEDLSIGLDYGDENFMFGGISNINLDAKENIYVLDWKNSRIQKFDSKGNFLNSFIIKKGQGPQEVSSFPRMAVTPEGIIYIMDLGANKIFMLNEKGEFLQSFKTDFQVSDIAPYSRERIALLGLKENKILHVYDLEGNHLLSFGDPFEVPSKYSQYKDMPNLKLPMRFDCSKDGKLFVLNPHKYEIFVFKDAELIKKIKGKNETFKPLMVSRSIPRGIGIIFPVVYVLEYKDRLYVTIRGSGRYPQNKLEIFENNKEVATLTVKGFAYAIDKKGRIYFAEEEDFPRMVRYLLKEE